MAYMCADSGNLMAIAQQVIQQQQQQQQQRQQQQQPQLAASVNPFSTSPSPWASHHQHQHAPDHFPFVIPDPAAAFADPFAPDPIPGFPPPGGDSGRHLDHGHFRMSDFGSSAPTVAAEFDSDEWMESLIGESPAESSVLMSEPWPSATECAGALFVDAFPSCSADISLPSPPPAASDVNRVFFSEPSKIPPLALVQHHQAAAAVASNPPAAQVPACDQPEPKKNCGAAAGRKQAQERSISSPPLLESLLQCARLADSDPHLATKSLIHVRESASELGDPTERVAFYFAEALHRRLLGAQRKHPLPTSSPQPPPLDSSPEEFTLCYKVLNDACPYFKFAQLTANQAIIEATESAGRIHIVDFGIVQGVQWPSLLQALATRPSGKPSKVRISGIPAPALGGAALAASLAATGNRLRDFAALLDLDFEFDSILTPIPEIAASTFRVDPDELVVVNFMLQLSQLLGDSPEPVERILRVAKSLGPRIVTLAEYEASLNHAGFVDRFGAALDHYAAVFESLDPAMARDAAERARMERVLIGHRILEVVGPFEGQNRRVRMAPKEEWRAVMERCGFSSVPLSNYAVSQAKLLLWDYNYSSRYTLLDSPPPCLTLAWGDRPLLTVSSWR
ncbi:Scarecrow-like protein [Musa troglodytarum]|uniref:Scarecrow-like protein n=1 Tax=Musa troglodytarum TaxID=320322 RepID=A0A9E7FIA5_9LILI|nr:Scarecrow-like protein [Musa troglodytarum]